MPEQLAKQVLFRRKSGKTHIAERLSHGTENGDEHGRRSIFVLVKTEKQGLKPRTGA